MTTCMNAIGHDPGIQPHVRQASARTQARTGGLSLIVVNRNARGGRVDLEGVLEVLARGDGTTTILDVDPPAKLAARIEAAVVPELHRIVVAGGDGTVNAALPAALAARLPLGVIPLGTANDFARTLGIPAEPLEAAAVIANGLVKRIDVGIVNGVPFLNAAGIGFSVELQRELSGTLKGWLGPLAYPIGVLRRWRRHRPFTVALGGQGIQYRHRALQVTVANGRFYGGGMAAHEDARIDDGTLDVIVVLPRPLWRHALTAMKLKRGDYTNAPVVAMQATQFELVTHRPMPIAADGEIVTATPAAFSVTSRALEVYVPDATAQE